jgi:hypothetical protein
MSDITPNASRTDMGEVLLMLASFSLRVQMFKRAEIYGRCGHSLFPTDTAICEMYTYALLFLGEYDLAAQVLSKSSQETANMSLLRARISMLRNDGTSEKAVQLRKYLQKQ